MRCNGSRQIALLVALNLVNNALSDNVCTPFTPTVMPKFTANRTTSYSTDFAFSGMFFEGLGSPIKPVVTAPFDPAITDCQRALADWSSTTSEIESPKLRTITTTTTWDNGSNYTLTQGTACADTTENGFAHAIGEFQSAVTTVSTSHHMVTWTGTSIFAQNASIPPRPGCGIDVESCSRLWNTFRSSLNITATPTDWWYSMFASAPGYTGSARNSPQCSQVSTGCTTIDWPKACTISGENVEIYYWPDQTSSHSRNITNRPSLSGPRTRIVRGITMTSPSIYLSFDYLAALTTSERLIGCLGPQAFGTPTWTGSFVTTQVGDALTSVLLSLVPQSVSTLEVGWYNGSASASVAYGPFPDAAIAAIAGTNQTAYNYWIRLMVGGLDYMTPIAKVLKPSDLVRPNPRAYYLRPRKPYEYPINCLPDGPRGGCNTIYDNQYQAQLSIPSEIISMQPAWSACVPGIHGIYDPPKALTGADDPVEVTITSQASSTTTAASPQSPLPDVTVTSTQASKAQVITTSSVVKQVEKPTVLPSSSPAQDGNGGDKLPSSSPAKDDNGDEKAPASAKVKDPGATSPPAQPPTAASAPIPQTIAFTTNAGDQQDASNALQALTQAVKKVSIAVPVAVITVDSTTLTASSVSGNVVLGDTTISSGQLATVNGATISNAGSAIIVQPVKASTIDTSNHVGSYIANGLGIDQPNPGSTSTTSTLLSAGSAVPSRAVYRGQGTLDTRPGARPIYLLSAIWLLVAIVQ